MKLDVVTPEQEVIKSDDFESLEYGIAEGNGALLFKILSQYSNPIGSLVREVTTNAFDSHIEAGINAPITVRINQENKLTGVQSSFEVEDYGVGLSPERVREIYSKFLASTKRDGNEQHGAFGLGSKSPLSYCDMFYVTTYYDGMEYVYTIHKGKVAPQIDLFDREPTDKENGTNVTIPIKGSDEYKFRSEIKTQLMYFDNINYEGCNIENDYQIFRGKHFMYRKDSPVEHTHISLGKVYYPIDFNVLQKSCDQYGKYRSYAFRTPIALRFEIGELPVVWNRENIEYTDEATEAIKEKLELAKEELQEFYNKKHNNVTSIKEYLEACVVQQNKELEISDNVFIPEISSLVETKPMYPKYIKKGLRKIPKDIFFDFNTHRYVEEGLVKAHSGLAGVYNLVTNKLEKNFFYCEDKYKTNTNKFIYHRKDIPSFHIIKKKTDLQPSEYFSHIFGLGGSSSISDEEKEAITAFRKEVEDYMTTEVDQYEDIEVPDEFLEWLKEQDTSSTVTSKNYNPDKEVPYKPISYNTDSYEHNRIDRYNFSRDHIKIKDLVGSEALTIYGHRDDADKLLQAASIFFSRDSFSEKEDLWRENIALKEKIVRIFKISQGNVKLIEDKLNTYHVDDFMKSKHKTIIKWVTARYLHENMSKGLVDLDISLVNKVIPEFASILRELHSYKNKYYSPERVSLNQTGWESLIALFEDKDLLDTRVIDKMELAKAYFNKYRLIENVNSLDTRSIPEFKYYMRSKGNVHPLLLKRLEEYKSQKTTNNEEE